MNDNSRSSLRAWIGGTTLATLLFVVSLGSQELRAQESGKLEPAGDNATRGVAVPSTTSQPSTAKLPKRPHVVLILADDLGYGDVTPLNPESSLKTPAFARLAAEGLAFTDAHSPSAVCTPTRYGLLTGRYCWRSRLKRGVLNGYGKPLIEKDRPTLGSVLQSAGYRTSIVGKWHLGLGLPGPDAEIDWAKPLSHHPGTVGFEHSFIIPASLDFPPYVYLANGRATTTDIVAQPRVGFPAFTRAGPRAADFEMRACLDRLTDEAVAIIAGFKESKRPSLLYFPLTAPHKPVLPSERFVGKSGLGSYGDFVQQVDATVERVLDALKSEGVLEETLLIVTSDNGSFMRRLPQDAKDHVDDDSVQGYQPEHHAANAGWRGTKADIWEAGHRVPFFVHLPNGRHAGARVDATIGLIDVLATVAGWMDLETAEGFAPDSTSFLPLLEDPAVEFQRPPMICHSVGGMFAVRHGKWKMIAGNGSGGRENPKGKPFAEPWMLFDLQRDPGEEHDVAVEHLEILTRLKVHLEQELKDQK